MYSTSYRPLLRTNFLSTMCWKKVVSVITFKFACAGLQLVLINSQV